MGRKPNPPRDDPKQSERFIAMAREVGAAEDEEGAVEALKKLNLTTPRAPKARDS